MNTLEGGKKLRQTMIAKYGSLEAFKAHMAEIGAIGGQNGTGHVFGHGAVDPSEAGRKGGMISKRRKKL